MNDFRYVFKIEKVKLDNRTFRQDSDSFVPHTPLFVCAYLPRTAEYVVNLEEIAQAELSAGAIPDPILTPAGYAYIKTALEEGFDAYKPEPSKESEEEKAVERESQLNPGLNKPVTEEW